MNHGLNADDASHAQILGPAEYILDAPALPYRAFAQNDHMISQRDGLNSIVRNQDRRYPDGPQNLPQLSPHLAPGRPVKRGKRFIEQKQPRSANHHTGQSHTLLLSARQLSGIPSAESFKLKSLHDLGRLPPAHPPGDIRNAVGDVVVHRQVRKERIILKQKPDAPPLGRQVHSPLSVEPYLLAEADPPAFRPLETGQTPQNGRLSTTRGTEQRGHGESVSRPPHHPVDDRHPRKTLLEVRRKLRHHSPGTRR